MTETVYDTTAYDEAVLDVCEYYGTELHRDTFDAIRPQSYIVQYTAVEGHRLRTAVTIRELSDDVLLVEYNVGPDTPARAYELRMDVFGAFSTRLLKDTSMVVRHVDDDYEDTVFPTSGRDDGDERQVSTH